MNVTNKHKLPKYFSEWLKQDDYDYEEGTISATTILKPLQMYLLEQRYSDLLEEDVMDRLHTKIGSAIHNSLEQIHLKGELREQRLRYNFCGYELTGKFDLMLLNSSNEYKLIDFKTTKTYKWVVNDFEDYIKQLSIYRWLADKNGIKVSLVAEIGFWFKDWEQRKTTWKNYPNLALKKKKLTLWSLNKTETFIKSRLQNIYDYKDVKDELLLKCNNKELWISSKGVRNRCNYCKVRKWCQQYKKYQEDKDETKE